ncbi:hypothetical protein GA0070616_4337 [Micromonospora nigra]|uniref:Uncharacterized protein n=1 Tax=Micromonospora nigra TaxID=145857 RepID=A0A1C6SQF3_9ACTN|nr:hypothetical protein [Micromonospora nigra]SCL31816.1 hypothetical protein GA0070616_4337 [Micromonospora nigra]
MRTIRAALRWLTRRPAPPVPPGTAQRIQDREATAAKALILAHARAAEHRYGGTAR